MIQEPSIFSWFNGSVDAPFSILVIKIIHVTSIFIGILWIFFDSDFCFFRSEKISSVLHHKITLNIIIFGDNGDRIQKCQKSKMTELTLWKDLVENIPRPFVGTFWISNLKINHQYVKDKNGCSKVGEGCWWNNMLAKKDLLYQNYMYVGELCWWSMYVGDNFVGQISVRVSSKLGLTHWTNFILKLAPTLI